MVLNTMRGHVIGWLGWKCLTVIFVEKLCVPHDVPLCVNRSAGGNHRRWACHSLPIVLDELCVYVMIMVSEETG